MSEGIVTGRVAALDLLKGVLVLFMVLYHWLNYFVTPAGGFYKYLRFITPSFIFISGFLVSHLYLRKYGTEDARMRWRLLWRGLRLLLVFVVLNVAVLAVSAGFSPPALAANLEDFAVNSCNVFLTGNGHGAAFSVLAPISYLLVFLSGYLFLTRGRSRPDFALCTVLLAAIYILHRTGRPAGYLELFTAGVFGFLLGRISPQTLAGLRAYRFELVMVYLAYLVWLSEWNEILPMQLLGVVATLGLVFALAARCDGQGWWQRRVCVLGSYSLLAYVLQMGVLLVLVRLVRGVGAPVAVMVVSFIAAFAGTAAGIEFVAWLRSKSSRVDMAYRWVFA